MVATAEIPADTQPSIMPHLTDSCKFIDFFVYVKKTILLS